MGRFPRVAAKMNLPMVKASIRSRSSRRYRYETYLIPGETLIPGEKVEAFHPGIGYASYLAR